MNPFTELTGSQFLGFYAVVAGIVLAVSWWWKWASDPTAGEAVPPVPQEVDPYELAYLRGGENELARVVIVNLTDRGYLRRFKEDGGELQIHQMDELPPLDDLNELEQSVFDWFVHPMGAEEIFSKQQLPSTLQSHCLTSMEQFYEAHLLKPDELKAAEWKIGVVVGVVLGGVGVPRLLIGWWHDQPSLFLFLMMAVAVNILGRICGGDRLSRCGQEYLRLIQERLKFTNTGDARDLTLAAAAFGVDALTGTHLSDLAQMFQRSSNADGGGACGAACGADGGGGGCGGCGGCG